MCFSPEASFTASAVLLTTAVACMSKVTHKSHILFAAIPLVFGLQQFSEGMLWVAMQNQAYGNWRTGATYFFACTGQLIWPLLVPFGVLLMEPDKKRKNILRLFCTIGVVIFLYLFHNIINYPVTAKITNHHMDYEFVFPYSHHTMLSAVLYVIPTVMSHFVSSIKKIRLMGFTVLVSLAVTRLFYIQYTFSVWCFFSALMSLLVYAIIKEQDAPEVSHALQHVYNK